MKLALLILFFCTLPLSNALLAQGVQKLIFKYRCVPTSTTAYSIDITRDNFILSRTEKKTNRKGERIKKVSFFSYTHAFDSKEKEILDSIIRTNRLDSIGLYQDRLTEWGSLWEVEIQQNSITYHIDLPNYNNSGLESLIHFIICLIPKKELPPFECKECN